jgi:hypothetical protein
MKRIIIPPHYRGLGQTQIAAVSFGNTPGESGNQEASSDLQTLGQSALTAAPLSGPGAPFVAAAGATLELAAQIVKLFTPCGQTCVDATQIADQVETVLDQNNQLYFTNPNRTTGDQANALSVVNTAFSQLQSACGTKVPSGTHRGRDGPRIEHLLNRVDHGKRVSALRNRPLSGGRVLDLGARLLRSDRKRRSARRVRCGNRKFFGQLNAVRLSAAGCTRGWSGADSGGPSDLIHVSERHTFAFA